MKARLYQKYVDEVMSALKEKRKYTNVHQVPRMRKIVVNMGISASLGEKSAIDDAAKDLALITGRKAAVSKSRHSIANFKLREGQPIGCRVTLRRDAMYEFFDRLVATALPRIRDFRGLSPRSFDGRGNYSLGIREQIIFPEIDYDSIDQVRGLDVTITTTAQTDEEAFALLEAFGLPFAKDGRPGAPTEAEEDTEEERRKAQARARAEAEQAALEQLKEENPEAYAKPP